jgi:hypothetical protein
MHDGSDLVYPAPKTELSGRDKDTGKKDTAASGCCPDKSKNNPVNPQWD